jgi:hypothetical protein
MYTLISRMNCCPRTSSRTGLTSHRRSAAGTAAGTASRDTPKAAASTLTRQKPASDRASAMTGPEVEHLRILSTTSWQPSAAATDTATRTIVVQIAQLATSRFPAAA